VISATDPHGRNVGAATAIAKGSTEGNGHSFFKDWKTNRKSFLQHKKPTTISRDIRQKDVIVLIRVTGVAEDNP
jgi:hypothetical protein